MVTQMSCSSTKWLQVDHLQKVGPQIQRNFHHYFSVRGRVIFECFFTRIHKNTGQPTLNASAEVIGDLIMEIVLSQWREGFVEAMDAQEFGQIADKLAGDVVALKAGCLDGQEK